MLKFTCIIVHRNTNRKWQRKQFKLRFAFDNVFGLADTIATYQQTVKYYCHRAFKLDEDSALLTYVRQQLLPATPPSTCSSPVLDSQDDIERFPYQQNVRKVVHKICSTASLLKLLVEVGSKVI